VFVVGAVGEDGYLHCQMLFGNVWIPERSLKRLSLLQNLYDPVAISMEKGQIEKSIGPFLRERMLETNTFPNIIGVTPSVDKLTRARSIQARMRAGAVKFDKVC
jgi:phage terminase large subunit-like protein